MNLTYRKLKEHLDTLSDDRLSDNVTVYLSEMDEYFPITDVFVTDETDVLDEGATYLAVTA